MLEHTLVSLVVLVLCGMYCYDCITITPERVVVTYVNEKYFTNVSATVRRTSKRGQYVGSIRVINKTEMGNNVTVHMVLYERSSRYNQYVRTLMELHYKWCDLVLRDIWFGPTIRGFGIKECPVVPGPLVLANITFSGKFPFDVSFDKGKIELTWSAGSSGAVMGSIDIYVNFSNSH